MLTFDDKCLDIPSHSSAHVDFVIGPSEERYHCVIMHPLGCAWDRYVEIGTTVVEK